MPETLLTPSAIKLYGRRVTDFVLVQSLLARIARAREAALTTADDASRDAVTKAVDTLIAELGLSDPQYGVFSHGNNRFLEEQLSAGDAGFARIYALSYEGHNYDLPRPAILVVHGAGTEVRLRDHDRSTTDTSGVVARDWEFALSDPDSHDLRMWEYDKGDFSLGFDVEAGTLEQILLAQVLRGGPSNMSGAHLGLSGAHLGLSGAHLGLSGAHLGISGAHLGRRR